MSTRNRGWTAFVVLVLMSSVPATFASDTADAALTQTWTINGSQTMVADPVRPLVYQVNYSTNELLFINSTTSAVAGILGLGQGPTSIDISPDGALLYVAISGDSCVSVIDIELGTILRDISLDFAPFSVTVGRSDRLYVSCIDDSSWRVVNEASGAVQDTVFEIITPVLEASPDGNELLVVMCGLSPTKVNLYDISTDNPSLTASDDHDLGSNFQEHAADWLNDVLYLANGGPYGLEVLSLVDLSRTGFLAAQAYTSGVALAPDNSLVYCLCSDPYASVVYVFDTASMTNLGTGETLPGDRRYLEMTGDGGALFVVDPILRIRIVPVITASAPAEGSVYAYTPSMVEAYYEDGLPGIQTGAMWLEADGTDLTVEYPDDDLLRGSVDWLMEDGTHWVNATAFWRDRIIWTNWSFEVDREDPSALEPELQPGTPEPDSVMDYPSGLVTATLVSPYPAPRYEYAAFRVDDVAMDALIAGGEVRTTEEIGLLEPGVIPVKVWVYYEQMTVNINISWTFTLEKYQITMPEIIPVTPGPEAYLLESPEYVEFDLTFGDPPIDILWLNVSVTGIPLDVEITDSNTARAEIDWELPSGEHIVMVTLVWDIGWVTSDWLFYIDKPWDLSIYENDAGFRIPLPVGWDRTEDQDDSDGITGVEVRGPVIDGLTTMIVLETAEDSTVVETTEYMESQIQIAIDELDSEGIGAHVDWTLYEEIDGHFGVVFLMTLDAEPAVVLTSVVVSEEHDRFWIIMMVFSSSKYAKANATFTEMVDGFDVTLHPWLDVSGTTLLLVAAVAGAAVAAPVGVFLYQRKRGRPKDESPAPTASAAQPMPAPPMGFCGMCGTPQPFTNAMCHACGRQLPSPPFGAAGQAPPPRTGL